MKPRPIGLDRLRFIRDMTDAGVSNKDIATALGISPSAVSQLRKRHGLPPARKKGPTHGLSGTYKHYGCRCTECRAANTRAQLAAIQRRAARRDSATFEHGTSGYGNWGCRCTVCTTANTAAGRERRLRRRERQQTRTVDTGPRAVGV